MFCKSCGKEISKNSEFCKFCGERVKAIDKNNAEMHKMPQKEFKGRIDKCPNCGEGLDSFKGFCPSCGYEIRGIGVVSSIKELADRLIAIDAEPFPESKSIFDKFQEEERTRKEIIRRKEIKESLIKNFPIPNTKEDLLEFMIYAMSQLGDSDLHSAWKVKYTQAVKKAQIMFPDDEKFVKLYEDFSERENRSKESSSVATIFAIGITVIIIAVVCLINFMH